MSDALSVDDEFSKFGWPLHDDLDEALKDEEEFGRQSRLLAEARGDDHTPGCDLSECDALGKVQQHALIALSELSKPQPTKDPYPEWYFEDDFHLGWVAYQDVTKRVARNGYRPNSVNALQAALSRAIWSLIDRDLIEGAFRMWGIVSGEHGQHALSHGKTPWNNTWEKQRPTLQYLTLANEGWDVVYSLRRDRLNTRTEASG